MKSIVKKRVSTLAILGFTLLLTSLFYINLVFYPMGNTNFLNVNNDYKIEISNLKASQISNTIHINNNWTDAKSSGICNGSGTWNDPYVIKNLIIDGDNSSNCIEIQNSNDYFRIENCSLFNAGSDWSSEYAGILLDHTNNGVLIDNNCSQNMYGIFIKSYSVNNTVYNNYENDNFYTGISLNTFCSNNTISGNCVNNNSAFGISISWNSHNNSISKNNATKNKIGLEIASFSRGNIVKENNFSYNTYLGGLTRGVRISRAENNSIISNIINQNGWEGIQVYESNYNLFLNNSINNNGQFGINFEDCESNIVKFNSINNHVVGIYLDDQSRCNKILDNDYFGNGVDIQDLQKNCGDAGLNPHPFDVLIISLTIVGLMILVTGTVLVLRNLFRIKMKNR
jgi:parallel beta-helix repeat protein